MNRVKEIQSDPWTLIVVTDSGAEFKYRGIRQLRNGELPSILSSVVNAPFVVIVQDEDSWEFWLARDRDAIHALETYLDSWEPQVQRFLVASPEELRPISKYGSAVEVDVG